MPNTFDSTQSTTPSLFSAKISSRLFFRRRRGFYLFLCVAAVALVMNIMFGAPIVSSLIGAVVGPLITYLVLKGSWEALS